MRALVASPLLLALFASTGAAAAQAVPTGARAALEVTVAKALLEEGKRLAAEGRLKEAIDKLEGSERYDPTPEALLEIGICQEKLGATASAWGALHRAEQRARMLGDQARAEQAAKRAGALEPALSRAKVVVTQTGTPPTVTLDDRLLGQEAWGVPLPLDRGPHELTASSPGKTSFSTTFALTAEGETKEVRVPLLAPVPVRSVPSASRAGTLGEGTVWAVCALTALGGTSLLLAVGFGIGSLGSGNADDKPQQLAAAGLVGGSAVFAAAAVTVGLLGSKKARVVVTTLPFQVGPMVAHSAGGLSLGGTF